MNQNWKWFDVGFRMVDMNDNDDECQRLFSALFLNWNFPPCPLDSKNQKIKIQQYPTNTNHWRRRMILDEDCCWTIEREFCLFFHHLRTSFIWMNKERIKDKTWWYDSHKDEDVCCVFLHHHHYHHQSFQRNSRREEDHHHQQWQKRIGIQGIVPTGNAKKDWKLFLEWNGIIVIIISRMNAIHYLYFIHCAFLNE